LCLSKQEPRAVKAAVFDHQDSLFRLDQTLDPRKGALVEILGLAGTMPSAGPQFQSDVPAFVTQIAGDRTVAIDALISAAHVFFLRIAIVHDEGVDLEAHRAFIRHVQWGEELRCSILASNRQVMLDL